MRISDWSSDVCSSDLARDAQGDLFYAERLAPAAQHVVLFGAGHVGQALVHILGTLPCRVVWVDEREGQFPDTVPTNVQIEATDTPEALSDQAPQIGRGSCRARGGQYEWYSVVAGT